MGDVPQVILVMGVAGSGKTTVGKALAEATGGVFLDSDDLCPAEAKAKMAAGIPLDDADRWPWIERLIEAITEAAGQSPPVVMAWSGLKRRYRDEMRRRLPAPVTLLFLAGDYATIFPRLVSRPGHFMRAGMLTSQFETLEPPEPGEGVCSLRIDQPLANVLAEARKTIQS